ncbi:ATP phosphoribosyltransferase regulatory subunit [Alkalibacterium sp. MB6]|uniref:ATP phosphoribosyltransferase regulatory subunit n=1 Tax=Alkalibacterium sp. MB6 TaxID=2081965 RepID=UPI00137B189A
MLDMSTLEQFEWDSLSADDLNMMKHSHTWQADHSLYSLRSDWTDAIVRYRKKYRLTSKKIAYSGPVYIEKQEKVQPGMEIFLETIQDQMNTMNDLLSYSTIHLNLTLSVAVISHYSLFKKMMSSSELKDTELLAYLSERNLDRLRDRLGSNHPVVRLMSQPVPEQLTYAKKHFPDLNKPIEEIQRWEDELTRHHIPVLYSDLFSLPTQSYYKGIFLQVYTHQSVEPVITGGQYSSPTKAFGMSVNLSALPLQSLTTKEHDA